jgi:hypothetical protein
VRRFLAWLGDRSPVDGDPLTDEAARDWAVRDYKRHLKAVERFKPASVNLALAALDSFYTQLGLGRPVVRREDLPASAPRALSRSSSGGSCEWPSGRRRGIGRSSWCCSTPGCGSRSLSRSISTTSGSRHAGAWSSSAPERGMRIGRCR